MDLLDFTKTTGSDFTIQIKEAEYMEQKKKRAFK